MLRNTPRFIKPARVSRLTTRLAVLPPHLKQQLEQRDNEDRATELADIVKFLSKWSKNAPVVNGLQDRPDVLHELDYIRILYNPPLTPSQRVRARRAISRLIESTEGLTDEEVEFLVSLLGRLGCL